MATVTDHATNSVLEGVQGSLLDYYRGEAKTDPDRYSIVEDEEVESPFPSTVTVDDVPAEVEQLDGSPTVVEPAADGIPVLSNEPSGPLDLDGDDHPRPFPV